MYNFYHISKSHISHHLFIAQTYMEIFQQLSTVNVVAVLISVITIFILMFNNEFLKPRVAKKTALPIPIELIIVVSFTLFSRYAGMSDRWNIMPVGHIPVGKRLL